MAENMSRTEIEEGIKKLIGFGSSQTDSTNREHIHRYPGSNDTQREQNQTQSPKKQPKKKRKKKKKFEESEVSAELEDNAKRKQQKMPNKGQNKMTDSLLEKSTARESTLQNMQDERDVLRPGLIISVNKESKRTISAYLAENKESTKLSKGKERKSPDTDLVTVDAKGNIVAADLESKASSSKKPKKKRKKSKISVTDSSGDEDDEAQKTSHDENNQESNIDEAVKKFWSMKTVQGKKTHGVKTQKRHEKSGNEADDEKGQNDDLNLDLSDLDDDISVDVLLQILERDRIFPLKKKSVRFPRARFFCRVCDYHMDTVDDVRRHGKDNRHQRRVENIKIHDELKKLSPPTDEQIKALDELVEEVYGEQHMTEAVLKERFGVVQKLELFLKAIIPDIKLEVFGSTLSGLGLVSSDVNVDLDVPKDHAQCLTIAFKAMKESDKYENVISDFTSKVPCIYFTIQDVQYRITIISEPARHTSHLLKLYAACDQRFIKLAVVFRYWAKICRVDKQDEGTLPAYSFYLLLIYYLQRCHPPVLPVLYQGSDDSKNVSPTKNKHVKHEEVDFLEIAEYAGQWKSENTESIGCLWLGVFRYYVLGFELNSHVVCIRQLTACTRAQKKWNTKKLAIEDPFSQKRNISKSVVGFELFEYIWDCVRKAYHYFGQPTNSKMLKQKKKKNMSHYPHHNTSKQTRKTEEKTMEKLIHSEQLSLSDTDDKTIKNKSESEERECATGTDNQVPVSDHVKIKDEDIEKNNSERSVIFNSPEKGKCDCIEMNKETESNSSQQFSSKSSSTGSPGKTSHQFQTTNDSSHHNLSHSYETSDLQHETSDTCDKVVKSKSIDCIDSLQMSEPLKDFAKSIVDTILSGALKSLNLSESEAIESHSSTVTVKCVNLQERIESSSNRDSSTDDNKVMDGMENNKPIYNYKFVYSVLTDGKGPAVFCSLCEKEGHLKHSCPEDAVPDLTALPKMTKSHQDMLSFCLKRFPQEYGPNEAELKTREMVRSELEIFIQELYPDCRLHLFGSSHNGFGFKQSDLDICVTFEKYPTGDELDYVECIEHICCKLKTHRGLYNVFPITTAKVPIVKFRHRRSQLEGDISMYNLLALHNTEMVRMYSAIDPRVRILGYALKVFARMCDIGDASRGSLSSYAYVLMLIHYLQQCTPPVIPVLQELYHHYGPDKPELMIDGWNAWYFDNMDSLKDVWLDYGKNRQSVGELWLGLFRYYTEQFNMKEQVVCCRQTQLLTKFEKLWNSPCIAIEDPFDLNHNLGGGISRKMHQFIHKAFIRGRHLYGTPRPDLQMDWKVLCGYYFDRERLLEGPAPNDRCCRACNKIGHIAKECPVVKNRKEREEKEKKRKAEQIKTEEEYIKKQQQYLNQRDSGNNINDRGQIRDQNSYVRDRVIHRTVSESHDPRYPSQPMTIPQMRSQPHRSMSLPSSHQGHYMSSPQGYHDMLQMSQHQSVSPQPYRQGPPSYSNNSPFARNLFNQPKQFQSSPGRSTSGGGHQRKQGPNASYSQQTKGNNSENSNRQGQSQGMQNSLFRQAEQYYKPKH